MCKRRHKSCSTSSASRSNSAISLIGFRTGKSMNYCLSVMTIKKPNFWVCSGVWDFRCWGFQCKPHIEHASHATTSFRCFYLQATYFAIQAVSCFRCLNSSCTSSLCLCVQYRTSRWGINKFKSCSAWCQCVRGKGRCWSFPETCIFHADGCSVPKCWQSVDHHMINLMSLWIFGSWN